MGINMGRDREASEIKEYYKTGNKLTCSMFLWERSLIMVTKLITEFLHETTIRNRLMTKTANT